MRMLVGSCDGCEHWEERDTVEANWGMCVRTGPESKLTEDTLAKAVGSYAAILTTHRTFGCTMWKHKEK